MNSSIRDCQRRSTRGWRNVILLITIWQETAYQEDSLRQLVEPAAVHICEARMQKTPAEISSAHRGSLIVFRMQENFQATGSLWDLNESLECSWDPQELHRVFCHPSPWAGTPLSARRPYVWWPTSATLLLNQTCPTTRTGKIVVREKILCCATFAQHNIFSRTTIFPVRVVGHVWFKSSVALVGHHRKQMHMQLTEVIEHIEYWTVFSCELLSDTFCPVSLLVFMKSYNYSTLNTLLHKHVKCCYVICLCVNKIGECL